MFLCRYLVYVLVQNLIFANGVNSVEVEQESTYTNSWIVRVIGGIKKAKTIAKELGFDTHVKVSDEIPNVYLFRRPKTLATIKNFHELIPRKLRALTEIKWFKRQIALKIVPDTPPPSGQMESEAIPSNGTRHRPSDETCLNFKDVLWFRQSYIQDCREKKQPRHDLNVVPAWTKYNLTGKNVKVLVVDEGIETDHPDLVDNYDPSLGLDLIDHDTTPDPVHSPWLMNWHPHGTRCAGVIAMRANNSFCGVGIAPSVTLGAVRLWGPKKVEEFTVGKALLFKVDEIDIVSNSWAFLDRKDEVWFDGFYIQSILKTGTTKGRDGKGLIYVFSCGSRKSKGQHCGRDLLRNSIYTITVASSDYRGEITSFSERCASIMVTTYSGDGRSWRRNVVSADIGNSCTKNHGGTSASAPMVAGAIALTLEANPDLTWRCVQHLLAWTSQAAPLQSDNNPAGTWIKNGAGFYVSHDFGFGMLDINELVEKAMTFQRVPPLNVCVAKATLNKQPFQIGLRVNITTDGCEGLPSEVAYLERVQLTLSLVYPRRGDLQIDLISPSGTEARLLERRSFDSYKHGIPAWTFGSIMTWGENPKGTWSVRIIGKKRRSNIGKSIVKSVWSTLKDMAAVVAGAEPSDQTYSMRSVNETYPGELIQLYLIFYGVKLKPHHYTTTPRPYYEQSYYQQKDDEMSPRKQNLN